MKCNKCGNENREDAKFCENCGNKLVNEANNTGTIKCVVCQTENPKGTKYCTACGANLEIDNMYVKDYYSEEQFNPKSRYATPSMVLGIIALSATLVLCCLDFIYYITLVLSILAIIFSILSWKATPKKGKQVAGLVCGIIAFIISAVMLGFILYYQFNPEAYKELMKQYEDILKEFQQ